MLSDDGYFPETTMLRRVMREKAVGLMYGQRALCIGALKPLNYVGTSEHSHHRETPFKRLTRTGKMFEDVYLGTRAQADRTLNAVAGMHRRVVGELPADAGPSYPKGTPYSAHDPVLMLWTVAVMVDSADYFYTRMVGPLSDADREELWQDWRRFLILFGTPEHALPATHADFRAYYDAQLAGDDLFLTDEARYIGYASAFEIPMPLSHQPGKRMHDVVMLASLPPRVRELYGLRLTARQAKTADAVARVHRAVRRRTPDHLATGTCEPEFEMVAATEQRRIAKGRYTPQVLDGQAV